MGEGVFGPEPQKSPKIDAQFDWTIGVLNNANEWRKFYIVPRSHPLRPLFCALFNRVGNRRAYRPAGEGWGSFPLHGGTFILCLQKVLGPGGPKGRKKVSKRVLLGHRGPRIFGGRGDPKLSGINQDTFHQDKG